MIAGIDSERNILEEDLRYIVGQTRYLWEELRAARIFISGGTGFLGCWLLESFAWANEHLALDALAVVLTRDPVSFRRKAPHLASCPSVRLHVGDVRSFEFPDGQFRFLIHAAGATNAQTTVNALDSIDTIVQGTRRVLEFARQSGVAKLLFTSSGAVYGSQPAEITHCPESYRGGPDPADPRSVYGESKRLAELLCSVYAERFGIQCKIARGFAFAGPYLPVDGHFAFGSFVRDALRGGPIRVSGDGTPYRSYLYAADLTVWLWTILFRGGNCMPYNVGSENAITITELANEIAAALGPDLKVQTARTPLAGQLPQRYVPATKLARDGLGLRERIGLRESILRTAWWHTQRIGAPD